MIRLNLYLILIITGIVLPDFLVAQVDVSNTDSNWLRYTQLTSRSRTVQDEDRFQGNLYLYDEWKQAEFELPDETNLIVDSVKFNLLRNQIEIFLKGSHMALEGSKFNSLQFVGEDQNATYKSKHYYFDDGKRLPGIVKEITVDGHGVLVAYASGIRQVSKENPLMIDKLKKDVVRVTKLKYIEKDGVLKRIKSKKDLLKYFGSEKEIKNFMSDNKLSHKNEEDIARVIAFAVSNG